MGLPSRSIGTARMVRKSPNPLASHQGIFRISFNVGDMNHAAFEQRPPGS